MKILVIGLDAATMDLIGPFTAAGHLPALASLIDQGSSSRLLSTPNMHSASAWTSILTGLNPGRHGLFVFSDRDFATGRQVFFKGSDRAGETIGSLLARHRLTAGFLNVPMTYKAECHAGGFMISGLDAPSLNDHAFCPAELRSELLGKFPDYGFTPPGLGDLMSAGRVDDAISAWLKLTETQTSAAEYLIESRPTDFFMTVYTASDWAGHNLWSRTDGASEHDGGEALLSIYRALDRAVARLLRRANDETQVYVISDHGMGPHTGASYHLADWLEAHGYMIRNRSAQARASFVGATRRAAKNLLPGSVKEKIKSGIGAERVKQLQAAEKDSFYSSIDWEQTTAYTEPGRHVININLAGRNASGKVSPADYRGVCDRIARDLSEWTDAVGTRVVQRVARRDEVYSGPFTERASDLYVYWNPAASLGDPPDEVRARGFWWSGDHRPEGVLIVKGPGIRRGVKLDEATVYDLVPTLMCGAKLPVPAGLDGRAIDELFTEEFLQRNPVKIDSASQNVAAQASSLSEAEQRLIEEKLRGLGYL
ncbi:MAG TPA: alkaline phosphatase family protein [Blastocatellia bacterium]|nr:alkaline phosphatase family protein [Blastocatellia bacterium]